MPPKGEAAGASSAASIMKICEFILISVASPSVTTNEVYHKSAERADFDSTSDLFHQVEIKMKVMQA